MTQAHHPIPLHHDGTAFPPGAELHRVPQAMLTAAMRRLQQANVSAQGAGLTPQEAETLVKAVADRARESFSEQGRKEALLNACGAGQAYALDAALRLGFTPESLNSGQIAKLAQHCGLAAPGSHAFAVLRLPVSERGNTQQRLYLVDPTYTQFFHTHPSGVDVHDVGEAMLANEPRRQLARQLLSQGFVELTPEHARLYLEGFVRSAPENPPVVTPQHYMDPEAGQKLQGALRISLTSDQLSRPTTRAACLKTLERLGLTEEELGSSPRVERQTHGRTTTYSIEAGEPSPHQALGLDLSAERIESTQASLGLAPLPTLPPAGGFSGRTNISPRSSWNKT